jgi:hypothetical protein
VSDREPLELVYLDKRIEGSDGWLVALAELIDENGHTHYAVVREDAPHTPSGTTRFASDFRDPPEHDLLYRED